MAGILPNIALIPQTDDNGEIMSGALLRIYEAGTNNPVTSYKDSQLTAGQEHPWPIEANAAGRIPMFWVEAPGDYRVRLSTADGAYIAFDIPQISAMGEAEDEGGGGGAGVSSEVIWQTGDLKSRYGTGTHAGFVRANGRTIGSASSGATERANADTQLLFEYLYAASADAILPVSGGRGVSAAADFAANKTIALPDWRGAAIVGLDDMGNSAAGRLTSTTFSTSGQGPTVLGALGGAQTHTLTTAQLPSHTHTFDGTTDSGGTNITSITVLGSANDTGDADGIYVIVDNNLGETHSANVSVSGQTGGGPHTHTFDGTTDAAGSGSAHPNVQPSRLVTIYIKL